MFINCLPFAIYIAISEHVMRVLKIFRVSQQFWSFIKADKEIVINLSLTPMDIEGVES